MNRLTLFVLTFCAFFTGLSAADKSAAPDLAGRYVGTWHGPSGSQGDLRLTLKAESATNWSAETVFTYESAEVLTKMKSVTVDGTKVVIVFNWTIDNTAGQTTLTGELAKDKLAGSYQTATEYPSSGTWSATRTKE